MVLCEKKSVQMEYKNVDKMNKISAVNPVVDDSSSRGETEEERSFASTVTFEGWFGFLFDFFDSPKNCFSSYFINSILKNLSL